MGDPRCWMGSVVLAAAVAVATACGSGARPTAVPNVTRQELGAAFAELRRAGFRVSTRSAFDAARGSFVARQLPAPGSKAKRGSVVVLSPVYGPIGSIAVPRPMTGYRLPDFVGERLDVAARWFAGKEVGWDARLPPIVASSATSLFAAFKVVAQRPAPGSKVRLGRLQRRGFHLTPVRFSVAE